MESVQSMVRPLLEARGYRLRARTFNRATHEGLTHVINFQMGQRSLQGKFTVNVGVYVPEVADAYYGGPTRSFVQEPECCVRQRLGMLGSEHRDRWWGLPLDKESWSDLGLRLERDALPFLERFETRDALFEELRNLPGNFGAGLPPRIVCAVVLVRRGEIENARQMLATQVREVDMPGHTKFVQQLSDRLGLGPISS